MATIGLSKPYYAVYNYEELTGKVTYSDGVLMGNLIEMTVEPEVTDDSNLYADNGIVESVRAFTGGNVSITTDHRTQEVSKMILGVTETEENVDGIDEAVKVLSFDDDMTQPELGFGDIIKTMKNGELVWRVMILPRVKFSIPAESATTQGESIEWQTPELSATLMKSQEGKHPWKKIADFKSEENAEKYIKNFLNILA
jgi:hypothetical protein